MTLFFLFFGLGALWALTSPRPTVNDYYDNEYDCDDGGYDGCDGGD